MGLYRDNLCRAMEMLAEQPNAIFLGQAVSCKGTAMHETLGAVPYDKRLELPVMEDCQLGMSTGLALQGYLPVSIYPRVNFLLLAINQLALHLDKLSEFSEYNPKVIIRTAIATDKPLDPQAQHKYNYTQAFRDMCRNISVYEILRAEDIIPTYEVALLGEGSSLVVEHLSLYGDN